MFRMYVDETGNSDFGASDDPTHRYLSLTGIVADLKDMHTVVIPEIARIKSEILELDPDEKISLHRKEIMQKKHPFNILKNPEKERAFNSAILGLLTNLKYRVITSVIDKQEHLRRYGAWRADPYHYCMQVLFERYCLVMRAMNVQGDVMAESRGKIENQRLQHAFESLCERPDPIRNDVVERHISSKQLKIRQKSDNIAGLQIADLIAHPSSIYVRSLNGDGEQEANFGSQIVKILIDSKYRRSNTGQIIGYGLKRLP